MRSTTPKSTGTINRRLMRGILIAAIAHWQGPQFGRLNTIRWLPR